MLFHLHQESEHLDRRRKHSSITAKRKLKSNKGKAYHRLKPQVLRLLQRRQHFYQQQASLPLPQQFAMKKRTGSSIGILVCVAPAVEGRGGETWVCDVTRMRSRLQNVREYGRADGPARYREMCYWRGWTSFRSLTGPVCFSL